MDNQIPYQQVPVSIASGASLNLRPSVTDAAVVTTIGYAAAMTLYYVGEAGVVQIDSDANANGDIGKGLSYHMYLRITNNGASAALFCADGYYVQKG